MVILLYKQGVTTLDVTNNINLIENLRINNSQAL